MAEPLYAFRRDLAIRVKNRVSRKSRGGVGGKAKLLPKKSRGSGSESTGGGIVALTVTGISSRSGSSPPFVWGHGTVELLDPISGELYDPPKEVMVLNSTTQTTISGKVVQAKLVGGQYFWDVEDCQIPSSS